MTATNQPIQTITGTREALAAQCVELVGEIRFANDKSHDAKLIERCPSRKFLLGIHDGLSTALTGIDDDRDIADRAATMTRNGHTRQYLLIVNDASDQNADDQNAGNQNQNAGNQNETPQPYPVLIDSAYRTSAGLVAALLDVLDDLTPPDDQTADHMRQELSEYAAIIELDDDATDPAPVDAAQAIEEMIHDVWQRIGDALPEGWMLDTHDGCWMIHECEYCALCGDAYAIGDAKYHADECDGLRNYPHGERVTTAGDMISTYQDSSGEYMRIDALSYSGLSGSYIDVSNCRWILNHCDYAREVTGVYGSVQVLIPVVELIEDAELVEAIRAMIEEYPIIDEMEASEIEQEIIRDAWSAHLGYEMLVDAAGLCEDAGDDAAAAAVWTIEESAAQAIAERVADEMQEYIEYEWLGAFDPRPIFSGDLEPEILAAIVEAAREKAGETRAA